MKHIKYSLISLFFSVEAVFSANLPRLDLPAVTIEAPDTSWMDGYSLHCMSTEIEEGLVKRATTENLDNLRAYCKQHGLKEGRNTGVLHLTAALCNAARQGNYIAIKKLLDLGAQVQVALQNPRSERRYRQTAPEQAAYCAQPEAIRVLLELRPSIAQNIKQNAIGAIIAGYALWEGALTRYIESLDVLLQNDAFINQKENSVFLEQVRELLEKKQLGIEALDKEAQNRLRTIAFELALRGARPEHGSQWGQKTLDRIAVAHIERDQAIEHVLGADGYNLPSVLEVFIRELSDDPKLTWFTQASANRALVALEAQPAAESQRRQQDRPSRGRRVLRALVASEAQRAQGIPADRCRIL